MTKPIVHYYPGHDDRIRVGSSAFICPIDHPDTGNVSNQSVVRTSNVISHNKETGDFETENSIYRAVKI